VHLSVDNIFFYFTYRMHIFICIISFFIKKWFNYIFVYILFLDTVNCVRWLTLLKKNLLLYRIASYIGIFFGNLEIERITAKTGLKSPVSWTSKFESILAVNNCTSWNINPLKISDWAYLLLLRYEGLNWSLYINERYAILSVQHKIPRGYFSYQKMFQIRFVYLLED